MLLLAGTAVQPAAAAPGDTSNWVLPLQSKSYKYSSEFGARCIPVLGGSTNHLGQDLVAPANTPILAAAGGTVVKTKNGTPGASGIIVIEHNVGGRKITSAYYHMWNAGSHVKVGDKVSAGQQIGLVGTSGPSTANHLHYEMWDGGWYSGTSINPVNYLNGKGVDLRANASVVWSFTTPSTCTYYSGTVLNLRARPNIAGALLKTLPIGSVMTSKPGTIVNNYVPVTVNGVSGWVLAGGVSTRKVAAAPAAPTGNPVTPVAPAPVDPVKTVAASNYTVTYPVNLREGAGTNTRVIRVVPRGTVVSVDATNGVWYRVPGGWIHSNYLRKTVSAPAPAAATKTTTANVNIRTGASTAYRSLKVLPKGTVGTVLGKSGSWTEIAAAGVTGWVSNAYLR